MFEFVKISARIEGLEIQRYVALEPSGNFSSVKRIEFLSRAHELIDELAGFVPLPEYSPPQAQIVSIGRPRPKRKL